MCIYCNQIITVEYTHVTSKNFISNCIQHIIYLNISRFIIFKIYSSSILCLLLCMYILTCKGWDISPDMQFVKCTLPLLFSVAIGTDDGRSFLAEICSLTLTKYNVVLADCNIRFFWDMTRVVWQKFTDPDDGAGRILWIVSTLLPHCVLSHARRYQPRLSFPMYVPSIHKTSETFYSVSYTEISY